MREASRPTVKQELAGIRRLFDWLTVRQVVSSSTAAAVRGPKHTVRRGTTPILSTAECRRFLQSIPVETVGGLRDRALVATVTYSFAQISAALAMNVKDVFLTESRLWLRLHEKGGKVLEVPCHHNLEIYLRDYIEEAGIGAERDGPPVPRAQPRRLAIRAPVQPTPGRQDRCDGSSTSIFNLSAMTFASADRVAPPTPTRLPTRQ